MRRLEQNLLAMATMITVVSGERSRMRRSNRSIAALTLVICFLQIYCMRRIVRGGPEACWIRIGQRGREVRRLLGP